MKKQIVVESIVPIIQQMLDIGRDGDKKTRARVIALIRDLRKNPVTRDAPEIKGLPRGSDMFGFDVSSLSPAAAAASPPPATAAASPPPAATSAPSATAAASPPPGAAAPPPAAAAASPPPAATSAPPAAAATPPPLTRVRSTADIMQQDNVSAKQAEIIQGKEILARHDQQTAQKAAAAKPVAPAPADASVTESARRHRLRERAGQDAGLYGPSGNVPPAAPAPTVQPPAPVWTQADYGQANANETLNRSELDDIFRRVARELIASGKLEGGAGRGRASPTDADDPDKPRGDGLDPYMHSIITKTNFDNAVRYQQPNPKQAKMISDFLDQYRPKPSMREFLRAFQAAHRHMQRRDFDPAIIATLIRAAQDYHV